MKRISSLLRTLYETNQTLLGRFRGINYLYAFILTPVTLILFLWSLALVFPGPVIGKPLVDAGPGLISEIAVFAVVSDLCVGSIRYGGKIAIEPFHWRPFPVGRTEKTLFHMFVSLSDYKLALYILPALSFAAYFLWQQAVVSAGLSILLFVLLALVVNAVIVTLQKLGEHLPTSSRAMVVALMPGLFMLVLSLPMIDPALNAYSYIPVIGFVGNGIWGLVNGNVGTALFNLLYLLISAAAGLLLVRRTV